MNPVLSAVWVLLMVVGVALIVLGILLRRRDNVRRGVPGNAVVIVGILLLVGGSAGLRQEATR